MRQDFSRHSNDSQHQHGGLGDSVGVYGLFNVYPLVSGQTKFFVCTRLSDVAGANVIVVGGGGQGGAELIRAEPRRQDQHATCCITPDISHHRL